MKKLSNEPGKSYFWNTFTKSAAVLCLVLFIFLSQAGYSQSNSSFYKIDNAEGELTKRVNIWGYVKTPGRYEIPASTNLVQLIAYAGGPRDYAVLDEIKIYRISENGKKMVKEVNVEEPGPSSQSDFMLYDEDTIVIDYSSAVTIREVFSFIGAPLALITSLVLIYDRFGK